MASSGTSVILPALPDKLKPLQHYLKLASEHDAKDAAVAYYARMFAVQLGLKLESGAAGKPFLSALMTHLEAAKRDLGPSDEAVRVQARGRGHVEAYALRLFLHADTEDRMSRFSKSVVKAFYTAGLLLDVLEQFGSLGPEMKLRRKYAMFKAAYLHQCLSSGDQPHPGPFGKEFRDMKPFTGAVEVAAAAETSGVDQQGVVDEKPFPKGDGASKADPAHQASSDESRDTTVDRAGGKIQPDPNAASRLCESHDLKDVGLEGLSLEDTVPQKLVLSQEHERCEKLGKQALESLSLGDYATARSSFREALDILDAI